MQQTTRLAQRNPTISPGMLVRESLLAIMEDPAPRRLVLIEAPAGFGKTTLIRQYQARQQHTRRFLWLVMGDADNDVHGLFDHIQSALTEEAVSRSSDDRGHGLDRIEALIASSAPLTLVLDEFENVHDEPALRAVRELMGRLPDDCELVIGSRHVPNIGVDKLRLQGEMVRIGTDQLRFTLPEVASLLRGAHKLQLTEAQLSTLHRRSEGWPGALQLFALSCDGQVPPENLLESFSESAWQLADSFIAALLQRLATDVRDFLIDSCVLGEFTAELCDNVMNRNDSRIMIDLLNRQGAFLERIDGTGEVWRYHALFAGMVRGHVHPERSARIHRRAGEWHLQVQQPAQTIDHLLAAGDVAQAGQLMTLHARSLLADGRLRVLLRWFERIPTQDIHANGELRIVHAWVLALNRRFTETNSLIEPILRDAKSPLCNEARTIHSLCLWMADHMKECFDEAGTAVANTHPGTPLLGGILANILAHCHIATNRFDEARHVLSQALFAGYDRRHGTFARIIADTNEAAIDLIQGRLGNALTRLRNLTPEPGSNRRLNVRRGITATEVMLAFALYERGEVEDAGHVLHEVLPYVIEHGTPDLIIDTHLLASRIAIANLDAGLASAYLDDLEREGDATGLSRLGASAWVGRSWLFWQAGQLPAAQHALGHASSPRLWSDAAGYVPHLTDFDSVELMRLRLSIEHDAAATAAILEQGISNAVARGRLRRALGLRVLHALALARSGKQNEAMIAIGEALRIAGREGHVRAFLDEGPALRDLVRQCLSDTPLATSGGGTDPFMTALRDTLVKQIDDDGSGHKSLPEPLSRREQDVLRILTQGLRNHEIAEHLALSETTVRTHLRSINQKLRANSRTDAVAIARRLGLVD